MNTSRHVNPEFDAVIVGSGPNGLAAAITMAKQGLRVLVVEGSATIGGGSRSAELTLPGFTHDVCSAVHPLALTSPFFRSLDLIAHGVEWHMPPVSLAHPLDGGRAVLVQQSVALTATQMGADAESYCRLYQPLVDHYPHLMQYLLSNLRLPQSPVLLARVGLSAVRSAAGLARTRVRRTLGASGCRAQALRQEVDQHAHAVRHVARAGQQRIDAEFRRREPFEHLLQPPILEVRPGDEVGLHRDAETPCRRVREHVAVVGAEPAAHVDGLGALADAVRPGARVGIARVCQALVAGKVRGPHGPAVARQVGGRRDGHQLARTELADHVARPEP